MIKLIGGALLLLAGIGSLVDPEAPAILIGFVIVGPILIIRGFKDVGRDRKESAITGAIVSHTEELKARLDRLQTIDRIAADFSLQYGIPPTRTTMVASNLIRELALADEAESRRKAARLLALQQVDSTTAPHDYLDRLGFDRTVFYVDETVKGQRSHPKERKAVEGTLILSSAYFYFFAKEKEGLARRAGERILDRASEHLLPLGILKGGYDLVSGISSELRDYFTAARVKHLRERLGLDGSFALPISQLHDVKRYTHTWSMSTTEYLQVEIDASTIGDKTPATVWLETTLLNESEWVREWIDRIELAAIPEGRLLQTTGTVR